MKPKFQPEMNQIYKQVQVINENGIKEKPALSETSRLQKGDTKNYNMKEMQKQKEERIAEAKRIKAAQKKALKEQIEDPN